MAFLNSWNHLDRTIATTAYLRKPPHLKEADFSYSGGNESNKVAPVEEVTRVPSIGYAAIRMKTHEPRFLFPSSYGVRSDRVSRT
ncbi:hypothetical protein ACLB2K_014890 [Fragaria x ananassa]